MNKKLNIGSQTGIAKFSPGRFVLGKFDLGFDNFYLCDVLSL